MIDTKQLRDKYAQRKDSRGITFVTAGSADVLRLCEAVERLELLAQFLYGEADDDLRTRIEQWLWKI